MFVSECRLIRGTPIPFLRAITKEVITLENCKTTVQVPCHITGRLAHRIIYRLQPIKSSIFITHNGRNINAKSLLGVLSLQLQEKDIITITCYHDSEAQSEGDIKTIEQIFKTINEENN